MDNNETNIYEELIKKEAERKEKDKHVEVPNEFHNKFKGG